MTDSSGQWDSVKVVAKRGRRWKVLLQVVLIAALIDGWLLAVYELIEMLWRPEMNRWTQQLLYLGREGMVSGVLTVVLVWWILDGSPPLLGQSAWDDNPHRQQDRWLNFARWMVSMRWIVVVAVVMTTFVMVQLGHLLSMATWWPLMGSAAVLATSNVLYTLLLRREESAWWLVPIQIYMDLVVMTVILHFSGGVENPLGLIMIIHVVLAGIMLTRRQCYAVALVGSVLFGSLALVEWLAVIPHYTLMVFPHTEAGRGLLHAAMNPLFVVSRVVMQMGLLALAAYFMTHLAERIRKDEHQLSAMAERVAAERQLLVQSLDTTQTAMRVLGPDRQCLWTSNQWSKWFRQTSDVKSNRGCTRCLTHDGVGVCVGEGHDETCALKLSRHDGKARITELTMDFDESNGEGERVFQMKTAPLLDRQGQVTHLVELVQDVTRQKRAQEQLVRTSKLAAIGELAGNIAHEVNNPVAIISAKARLLLSNEVATMSDKVEAELHKIVDLADRAARIARSVLSYCRPSGARRTVLDVRDPLSKAMAPLEQQLKMNHVWVEQQLDAPLFVRANADELVQVFFNLILNAVDAMPDGGTLRVSDQGGGDGGEVVIEVADDGVGIDPAVVGRIFEPFFTTKRERKGTGLGLSVCHGLIRSHGGKIDVHSRLGEGTRFVIRLPAPGPQAEKDSRCLEYAS